MRSNTDLYVFILQYAKKTKKVLERFNKIGYTVHRPIHIVCRQGIDLIKTVEDLLLRGQVLIKKEITKQ